MIKDIYELPPESVGQLTKQQAIIYKRILDNGYVTSAEAEQLLDVKQRRARAILKNMSENGMIKKSVLAKIHDI